MTDPDWLRERGGSLEVGPDGKTRFLMLNGQPQYRLIPVPAEGKYGCAITQTINGKRIPSKATEKTPEEAIQVGLQDLREALGWG